MGKRSHIEHKNVQKNYSDAQKVVDDKYLKANKSKLWQKSTLQAIGRVGDPTGTNFESDFYESTKIFKGIVKITLKIYPGLVTSLPYGPS